jgi:hypothetical protein
LIKKLRKLSPMLQSGSKLQSVGATRKQKEKLVADEWSASDPDRFTAGKEPPVPIG